MFDQNRLSIDAQRHRLGNQMRVSQRSHLAALSTSMEALARGRELLAAPFYDPMDRSKIRLRPL